MKKLSLIKRKMVMMTSPCLTANAVQNAKGMVGGYDFILLVHKKQFAIAKEIAASMIKHDFQETERSVSIYLSLDISVAAVFNEPFEDLKYLEWLLMSPDGIVYSKGDGTANTKSFEECVELEC